MQSILFIVISITLMYFVLSVEVFQSPPSPVYIPTGEELAFCLDLPPPDECPPLIQLTNPLITMTTPELIEFHGYPVEAHHVTSQGGYILTLFRIPHGKIDNETNPSANKSVVVLMHGFLCSSSDWFMQRESNTFPFLLADSGYDVWVGNARGSKYSLGHLTLRSYESNSPYWDFSWHEMGIYDVPALIDYILNKTNQPNLYWIGHSMGNTMVHVTLSTLPEYNKKIRTFFALAPAANFKNGNNILLYYFGTPETYQRFYETFGFKEFIPKFIEDYLFNLGLLCQPFAQELCIPIGYCKSVLFLIFGYDCPQVDSQIIPIILGHTPSNVSARVWDHFMQLHWNDRFAPFDFSYSLGRSNMEVYGDEIPPMYDLRKIIAPVVYLSAYADNLATPTDVCNLSKKIPGMKEIIQNVGQPNYKFNHIDFLYAKDAKTFVYDRLIARMKATPSGTNEIIETQDLKC